MKWTKEKPKMAGWYWCKVLWCGVVDTETVFASENPITHKVDSIYYEGRRLDIADKRVTKWNGVESQYVGMGASQTLIGVK